MQTHCIFCACHKEIWKPMDSYQSDRSCEFYIDVSSKADELHERFGQVNFHRLYKACLKYQKKYPDIPNYWAAIQEIMESHEDMGIYT